MNGKAKSNSSRATEVRELPVLPPVREGRWDSERKNQEIYSAFAFQFNSISSLAVQLYSFKFENVCVS